MARAISRLAVAVILSVLAAGSPHLLPTARAVPSPRTLAPSQPSAADHRSAAPNTLQAAGVVDGTQSSARSEFATLSHPARALASDPPAAGALREIDDAYPLHGLAIAALAQVFAEPAEHAAVSGYLRRGGRLRARPAASGNGCATRWYAVLGGGFVCAGRSFLIGEEPPQFEPLPEPPALFDALPYRYAKTTAAQTPLYLRVPTDVERRETAQLIASGRAFSVPQPKANTRPARTRSARQRIAKANVTTRSAPVPGWPDVVRMVLRRGYYVSVDATTAATPSANATPAAAMLRTVRGDWLTADSQTFVTASRLQGTHVDPARGQLALVARASTPAFRRDAISGALTRTGALRLMQAVYLSEERVVYRGRSYRLADDGQIVSEDALRPIPHTPRPPFVPRGSRYIAVQLSTQTLVAYDGERPVYATLVSTGKPEHATPTGIFRIQHKHVATTMDGEVGSDDAYSIEDVPWTMYFSGSLALHGAFWHEHFGRPHSHGCINLAPLDARWLFEWAGPNLPVGFHGVMASDDNPGTFVVITP